MTTSPAAEISTIEQLSISNPSYVGDPTGEIVDDDILPPIPFDRQARPQSTRTVRSTTSRSSVNNLDGRVTCLDYQASKYFSYKVKANFQKFQSYVQFRSQDQGFEKALFSIQKGFFPLVDYTEEYKRDLMKRSWLLIE